MNGSTIRRWGLLAAMAALSVGAGASIQQTKIAISRALNSPTLAVKYEGANVTLIEMRINGESFGTRMVSDLAKVGETTFSLDVLALKDGENEIEIRLFDKTGKLIGTQKSTITAGEGVKAPIFLSSPKSGDSVLGPVEITVGFGKEFKNSYVSFFVDDQFKSMSNFPPYTYLWDTSRETNGWHEVEAWVVDETSSTFKTRKTKIFVNNPGGRTMRSAAPDPVVPKVAPVSKPVANPLGLTPTANPVAPSLGTPAKVKPIATKASEPVAVKVAAPIAPAIAALESANEVSAFTEASAGLKTAVAPKSVEVGPRLLTPTGKRVVAPMIVKPVAAVVKPIAKPTTLELVGNAASPSVAPVLEASVGIKPMKLTGSSEAAYLATPAKQPSAPKRIAATAKPVVAKPVVPKPVKAAPKPVAKTIPVVVGTKLPIRSTYTILFNGEPITFDVAPRIEVGVPVTPFRHLILKAGGSLTWQAEDKAVEAFVENRTIWIKIGDRIAKVDKLPVEMELAPFLESGRTVVPLSFLRTALKIEIEYDKATGHVLITKAK